jgi:hypothetical protein
MSLTSGPRRVSSCSCNSEIAEAAVTPVGTWALETSWLPEISIIDCWMRSTSFWTYTGISGTCMKLGIAVGLPVSW